MPIRVACNCKRLMTLLDKYAGQHVQCPHCRRMLRIPTEAEDRELTRWTCSCGQRLKARARTAGRQIACPRCKSRIAVPLPEKYQSYIEEKFTMDESSGIIRLAPPSAEEEPALKQEKVDAALAESARAPQEDESGFARFPDIETDEDDEPDDSETFVDGEDSQPSDRSQDESGSDLLSLGAQGPPAR